MAHHHSRNISRPRLSLRCRSGPDLRASGRLVQVVQNTIGNHGPDSADARRHLASSRIDESILHRDFNDRLHRRCWNHRSKLHHPCRFHRIAPLARNVAGTGSGRRWCGALPSHVANGTRRGRRRECDSVRSDLSGVGHFAYGGRSRLDVLSRITVPVLYYLSERAGTNALPPIDEDLVPATD